METMEILSISQTNTLFDQTKQANKQRKTTLMWVSYM